jgi:hypothetical protein
MLLLCHWVVKILKEELWGSMLSAPALFQAGHIVLIVIVGRLAFMVSSGAFYVIN